MKNVGSLLDLNLDLDLNQSRAAILPGASSGNES